MDRVQWRMNLTRDYVTTSCARVGASITSATLRRLPHFRAKLRESHRVKMQKYRITSIIRQWPEMLSPLRASPDGNLGRPQVSSLKNYYFTFVAARDGVE